MIWTRGPLGDSALLMDEDKERIAKVMARAGVCSRREAEAFIAQKRVTVNGQTIIEPGTKVGPADVVALDGEAVKQPQEPMVWRFHKRAGQMVSHKDPEGRPTVFEALPPHLPRVVSVGRLDYATEGLLLLTNDGEIARFMELPKTGWTRRYRVRAYGKTSQEALDELAQGVTVEGVHYGPIDATLDRVQGHNVWLTLALKEGKNREVRRVLEAQGLSVNRLIRMAYGPFQLGRLKPGEVEQVPGRVLRDQLGVKRGESVSSVVKARLKGNR